MKFKGEIALVTGGVGPLGKQIVERLAREGAFVVIHYFENGKEAAELQEKCRQWGGDGAILQGDFSSRDGIESFARTFTEKFPGTRFLVNTVGTYLKKPLLNSTFDEWDRLFLTNVTAPFILASYLSENLKKALGKIINLGIAGLDRRLADDKSGAYFAAKQALWSLTRSLAKEFAPFKVTVNMVSPGYLEKSVDLPALENLPFGRLATLEETALWIIRLLEKDGDYITGQNIEIAGGVRL